MRTNDCNVKNVSGKWYNALLNYVLVTLALTVVFCLSLYIAGLGGERVQNRIRRNIKDSSVQLESELTYPRVFDSRDASYTLDNFTDIIIMETSYYMDTHSDYSTIFSNPYFIDYSYEEDRLVHSFTDVGNGAVAKSKYARYWQGYRVFVRPLLCFMNYQSIRGFISTLFLLLFIGAVITICRHCNWLYGLAFAMSVIFMNIPVLSSCLQFAPCYYLGFIAVIVMPYMLKKGRSLPMFFFILGACTQFFDFYTTPLITFGMPMLFIASQNSTNNRSLSLKLWLGCAASWAFSYGAFWIIRLALTSFFLETDTFSYALSSFMRWTSITSDDAHSKVTVAYMIDRVLDVLTKPKHYLMIGISFIAPAGMLIRDSIAKRLVKPNMLMFVTMLLPVVWMLVAYKATGNHFWYQYRSLSVSIYGFLSFIISSTRYSGSDTAQ